MGTLLHRLWMLLVILASAEAMGLEGHAFKLLYGGPAQPVCGPEERAPVSLPQRTPRTELYQVAKKLTESSTLASISKRPAKEGDGPDPIWLPDFSAFQASPLAVAAASDPVPPSHPRACAGMAPKEGGRRGPPATHASSVFV